MPTYQYECSNCGHEFEIMQSMNDDRLKKCPKCSKAKLNRLIGSGSGIIFKGTGFYETDYKKKTPTDAPPKDASKDSKSKDASKDSKTAQTPSAAQGCAPNCGCH